MKKRIGQVFSLALAVTLVIAMAVPAHADVSDAAGYAVGELWDMMTGKEADIFFDYWKNFTGYLVGEECPSSPDKYHHGNTPVGGIGIYGSGGTDDNGRFVLHVCDYCQKEFKVYGSDLQQSYEAQVAEMPATGYTSSGSLLLYSSSSIHYVDTPGNFYQSCSGHTISELVSGEDGYKSQGYRIGFSCESDSVRMSLLSGFSSFPVYRIMSYYDLVAPYDGYYEGIVAPSYSGNYLTASGASLSFNSNWGALPSTFCTAGSNVVNGYATVFVLDRSDLYSLFIQFYPAVFKYTPALSVDIDYDTTYNINSRPTSITGDYGIIGDNGQIVKVEGDRIVNETNNTIYNPVTGQTHTMSDWSFNYQDRSYTVTTESGDTITITYGDENVVIKEGDTIYNVYYLVNGSGSETPDPGPDVPGPCNHQWSETSSTPATCTVPGSRTLTCSLCNQTKVETIPAPGHKWVIRQTVNTEYDDAGNKTQEGYTIFECSVCGEQYKSTDGSAPPGGGSSTNPGSSNGVFSGIFGLLLDFLLFFWNTFKDFVGSGVKGFLASLADGTSSVFGLLNPFNWGG